MAETPVQTISAAGFPVYLHGLSAIDSYLCRNAAAAVDTNEKTWYFRCEDPEHLRNCRHSFSFLDFYQDCATRQEYFPCIFPENW